MGAIATFSYSQWQSLFPALAYISEPTAQQWFDIAGQFYLRNDGSSPVRDSGVQLALLNLLTAHLCQLFVPSQGGGPASTLVGRIASASEGSVTVSAEYASQTSQSMAWYVQTPYGASYWDATKVWRSMRYVSGPRRIYNLPWPSYLGQ